MTRSISKKLKITLLVVVVGLILYFGSFLISYNKGQTEFGISFSPYHAEYLGLDWRKTYLAILEELKPKSVRLAAYWNHLEKKAGEFTFNELDFQIEEAAKRGIDIVLVIGRRLPRWPECHVPVWAKELPEDQQQERILAMIQAIVENFKDQPAIKLWQIENEPFLSVFGQCPKVKREFVQREIDLVRSLDARPIMITDSGELSSWYPAIGMADYFGTTLYRVVWNQWIGYWGYNYIISPTFYRLKAALFRHPADRVIISELQAEPWAPQGILATALEEQKRSMGLKQLQRNIKFAQDTGFAKAYFWGAEWWYWLKEKQNDDSYWQEVKEIISNGE